MKKKLDVRCRRKIYQTVLSTTEPDVSELLAKIQETENKWRSDTCANLKRINRLWAERSVTKEIVDVTVD